MSAMDSAIASSNEFSMKLLHLCRKGTPEGNVFFSPASITICLSMLKTGAKENTLRQIEQVLSIRDDQRNEEGFGILSRYLQELKGPVTLKISNILAVDQQFVIRQEFIDNLQSIYNSEVKKLPFQSDPEISREEINRMIEEATNGKIKETLDPGSISPDVKVILANAIYFLGKWKDTFDSHDTTQRPFYTIGKQEVIVDMMFQKGSYRYLHCEDLNSDMLEIPYLGETVSLIILLPRERYGLPILEKNISVQKLNEAYGEMHIEHEIGLQLPKFKLEEKISLEEHLQNLGMTEAFSRCADLTGISSGGNLFVSSAFHKTFLDINEEGTEAAAVTGLRIMLLCAPFPPRFYFTVDHPFMMFIREKTTGLILFLGSIQSL